MRMESRPHRLRGGGERLELFQLGQLPFAVFEDDRNHHGASRCRAFQRALHLHGLDVMRRKRLGAHEQQHHIRVLQFAFDAFVPIFAGLDFAVVPLLVQYAVRGAGNTVTSPSAAGSAPYLRFVDDATRAG